MKIVTEPSIKDVSTKNCQTIFSVQTFAKSFAVGNMFFSNFYIEKLFVLCLIKLKNLKKKEGYRIDKTS